MMIIKSILDNDLYKFTQQQAVLERFPDVDVSYRFTNRSPDMIFSQEAFDSLKMNVDNLQFLKLTKEEIDYVRDIPFFKPMYVEYLRNFKFDPSCVTLNLTADVQLELDIAGKWHETILFEVPLLALISEIYFQHMDTDWNHDRQDIVAKLKANLLEDYLYGDFGTRRRRNVRSQDDVVASMKGKPGFVGTSNVYFAMKHGVKPLGTIAHEFFMAVSALEGLRHANRHALNHWVAVYGSDLGIALTDTFGTEAFFEDFDLRLSNLFRGLRHDSGDPLEFTDKAIAHYEKMGIDPKTKTILFSDGLDCLTALRIAKYCSGKVKFAFGIGTDFTNDYLNSDEGKKSKPMNIVIKLRTCNGIGVVKLSDSPGKATGDADALRVAKWTFYGTSLDAV